MCPVILRKYVQFEHPACSYNNLIDIGEYSNISKIWCRFIGFIYILNHLQKKLLSTSECVIKTVYCK